MESHQRPGGCRKPCTVLSTARRVNFLSIIARLSKECKRFFPFFRIFLPDSFPSFKKAARLSRIVAEETGLYGLYLIYVPFSRRRSFTDTKPRKSFFCVVTSALRSKAVKVNGFV